MCKNCTNCKRRENLPNSALQLGRHPGSWRSAGGRRAPIARTAPSYTVAANLRATTTFTPSARPYFRTDRGSCQGGSGGTWMAAPVGAKPAAVSAACAIPAVAKHTQMPGAGPR